MPEALQEKKEPLQTSRTHQGIKQIDSAPLLRALCNRTQSSGTYEQRNCGLHTVKHDFIVNSKLTNVTMWRKRSPWIYSILETKRLVGASYPDRAAWTSCVYIIQILRKQNQSKATYKHTCNEVFRWYVPWSGQRHCSVHMVIEKVLRCSKLF